MTPKLPTLYVERMLRVLFPILKHSHLKKDLTCICCLTYSIVHVPGSSARILSINIYFTTKLTFGLSGAHLQFQHPSGGSRKLPHSRAAREAEQVPCQPELHS